MSLSRFGVHHPVPVNLLMTAVLVGGLYCGLALRREFFPQTDPHVASITLPYPGATAEEIEQTLAIKVEDKLQNAVSKHIKTMTTSLSEGGGGIMVEFREGTDPDKAIDDVERAISQLMDLPEEAEEIKVTLFEPRLPVIMVTIYGDVDEAVMKRAIRAVRDDLQSLPGMGEIVTSGVREDEVRVDVGRDALVRYGISLPRVADAIRAQMRDIPGGTVRGAAGNVQVRTLGVREQEQLIREIEVISSRDGASVKLGDFAQVSEGFVDEQVFNRFNGRRAASLTVFAVGEQDIVQIARMVRGYVQARNGEPFGTSPLGRWTDTARKRGWELGASSPHALPPGARIATQSDLARFVEGRLDLLLENALQGAVLVLAVLLAALNWRAAMWVFIGVLVAIAGTAVLMYVAGITLNLLTMFGLIIALGLQVDDAIVVSENIQTRHDRGEPTLDAAVKGAEQVQWPVVATVLTTVVAFLPLMFIRGEIGDLLGALPVIVVCALLMSLVESLLLLPSHMAHSLRQHDAREPGRASRLLRRLEAARDRWLFDRVIPRYVSVLDLAIRYRYLTIVSAAAVLVVSLGMVAGGRVPFEFLAASDSETVIVDLRMPIGTPVESTNRLVQRVEAAATAQPEVQSVSSNVGQSVNIDTGQAAATSTHVAQLFIELHPVESRDRESSEVIGSIRRALAGRVDEAERLSFSEIHGGPGGADITFEFRGADDARVLEAARQFKLLLADFDGVTDIADDNDNGQLELQMELRSGAEAMGFTRADVARQVRGALYGIDAHVFAANQEDVDVRVRLDEPARRSLYTIENGWVISPTTGLAAPLSEVVAIHEATIFSTLRRIDRQRAVTVTADALPGYNIEDITRELEQRLVPLASHFPGVSIDRAGRQRQMTEAFASLPWGFAAAILMIYVILAWLFANYWQPLIVLMAVPFAIIGVIWGHWLLGYTMTFLSLIGFIALSGVVVNDSLIFVEFYNHIRREGRGIHESLLLAGRNRWRAIMVTTVTSVLGLLPLVLEQSFQAKFLIPMAIAISGGLISATVLILLVMPAMIVALHDIKRLVHLSWFGEALPHDGAAVSQER